MRIWIEFRDERIKQYEVDDLPDAMELVNKFGLTVKDWDVFSFRLPPRPPEPKEEIKYLPC